MLQVGDKIPLDIKIKNEQGEDITLQSYLGDNLLIYFYPKDMTPGCTVQAGKFRDANSDIQELGVKVIGISSDSVKRHLKFKEQESLNFELLSDETKELQDAFGVIVEKSMFGKKYMGTSRSTFLVNSDGIIQEVWVDVNPKKNTEEVISYLKENKD